MDKQAGNSFGAYIRQVRKNLGFSHRQVEIICSVFPQSEHISKSYLSQIEKGISHPSPDKLRGLSRAYQVPYQDLMKAAGYLPGQMPELPAGELTEIEHRLRAYIRNVSRGPAKERRARLEALGALFRLMSTMAESLMEGEQPPEKE